MLTSTIDDKQLGSLSFGPAGFTLIEVLLAMAITAFVGVVAYSGLSTAINAAEVNEAQAKRLAEIQMSVTLLERDLRHMRLRPIVDQYGDTRSALSGGFFADYPLQFTRIGWDNPRELRRGETQRVRYLLEDQQLWRESWSVLDQIDDQETLQRVFLIDGVQEFNLRFLDGRAPGAQQSPIGGEWVNDWSERARSYLPRAIEFSIELENFGEILRLIEIPSG